MGQIFFDVILPVALVAILGGLVGHWRRVPVEPVSALVFYLFTPALIFHSMATTTLTAALSLRIVGVMVITFLAMYLTASLWSRAVRHEASWRAGFALAAVTPNWGNLGIPVARLAFGATGFDVAVVSFVVGALLAQTGSVAIASLARAPGTGALLQPLRYPAPYAAAAGIVVNALGISLPAVIETPVKTLSEAAIPVMLVVLGLQLRHAVGLSQVRDTAVVSLGRLLIAPIVAWATATAIGLGGVERATLTLLAAMPTAVVATIIAQQLGAQPGFVTRVVVTTSVLSMVTLTALITLLR